MEPQGADADGALLPAGPRRGAREAARRTSRRNHRRRAPNPSLSFAPGYDTGVSGAIHPWIVPLSFDWPVETAGKRGYRLAEAQHLAAAARWDLVAAVWRVRSRLRATLLALYAARQSELLLKREESARARVFRLLEGQLKAGASRATKWRRRASHWIVRPSRGRPRQVSCGKRASRLPAPSECRSVPSTARDFRSPSCRRFPWSSPARRYANAPCSTAPMSGAPWSVMRPASRRCSCRSRASGRTSSLGPGFAWNEQLADDREWELGLSLPLPVRNRNQGPIAEAKAQRGARGGSLPHGADGRSHPDR